MKNMSKGILKTEYQVPADFLPQAYRGLPADKKILMRWEHFNNA